MTIPKRIREFLRLKPGDLIDFIIDGTGKVLVQAATVDVSELKGLLYRSGRQRVTLAEMDAAIARHHKKRR